MKIIRFSIFLLLFLVSINTFAQAPYATLREYTHHVSSITFSPDGKTLAGGSASLGVVRLWNATTGTLIRTLAPKEAGVRSITFSPDGKTLASGGDRGTVLLWNATTGTLIHTQRTYERCQ